MKKNYLNINLILLLSFSAVFGFTESTLQPGDMNWQFVSEDNWDSPTWRKEANFWYDKCAEHNTSNEAMSFKEKLDTLEKNYSLDCDSNRWTQELEVIFPDKKDLNIEELKDKISEKKREVETLKTTGLNAIKNKEQELIAKKAALQKTVEELRQECINLEYIDEDDELERFKLKEAVFSTNIVIMETKLKLIELEKQKLESKNNELLEKIEKFEQK